MTAAAQYLRVSSAQQKGALDAQSSQIAEYAARHGFEIIRTYQDIGRSGLSLRGRSGLQNLLADVVRGSSGIAAVLVQDISRWGRFQDTDEAAHYEFVCRQAGVEVRYCAEPFDDAARRSGDLLKAVKRLMAADFSRELSAKVRSTQYRHAKAGFKMGGVAGYGLRRAIIDEQGQVTAILESGQQRLLRNGRVALVPGPPDEVATVQRIFQMFLDDELPMTVIAKRLNHEGIRGENGRAWGDWTVAQVLGNPKYSGDYLFGRRSRTLDGRRITNPQNLWVHTTGAIVPLVSLDRQIAAARKRHKRMLFLERHEIWTRLQDHLRSGGTLTQASVNASPRLPSARTCKKHFGTWRKITARLHHHPLFSSGLIDRRRPAGDWSSDTPGRTAMSSSYAAFLGNVCIARGDLPTVTRAAHQAQDSQTEMPIVFDDATGLVMDLDLRGSVDEALRRLRSASSPKDEPHEHSEAKRSRGRPKLGVTAREVTLLPKHWAWLNRQTGGASAALRRLVEQAAKDNANIDRVRDAQEAVYKVMYALGGHLPGYEGALRALYALDEGKFKTYLVSWPHDVKAYLDDLSRHAFSSGTSA